MGGGRSTRPRGSDLLGDLLQVAVAAGIADQAAQGEAQQVGGGDHLCQVSSEGRGGIEPVGTVGVALEDHLNSGAVDFDVGDGAALLNGEGAEDRSGGGGHELRLRFALEFYRMGGGRSTRPRGSEVVCHVPAVDLKVRMVPLDGGECLSASGSDAGKHVGAAHPVAGVNAEEQELKLLLLLSEHVFPVLLGGDVCLVDLHGVGEGGHRVWCGLLWNSTG